MTLTIMIGAVALLLVIGVPLGFAMGLGAFIAVAIQGTVPLIQLPIRTFNLLDNFALLAVPLFIFAGELMNGGGITARILHFCRALLGHIRGGLAQVNILASMIFAGVSGSALADVAAIGTVMIPGMVREGYRRDFSAVVTAASSLIGPIIPPSIIGVIYGSLTGVSIGKIFLAGIIPGVTVGLTMMTLTWFLARWAGAKPIPRAPAQEVAVSFLKTTPAMMVPLIIVGGIVGGVFTPTEAGAVAVLYAIIYGVLMGEVTHRNFFPLILRSAKLSANVLFVIAGAGLFSFIMVREGASAALGTWLVSVTDNEVGILLLILLVLFFLGMFLDGITVIIISVPVIAPIGAQLGYDPVQFGMITIMMLMTGTISPPVGLAMMLAARIANIEFEKVFLILTPYLAVFMVVVLMVAFIPGMTLWLPSLIFPN